MKKIIERARSNSGLTLLEVIIALGIISIISIAFLNLFKDNYVSLASFGRRSSNVITATQRLEQVYAEIYGDGNTAKASSMNTEIKSVLEGMKGKKVERENLKEREGDYDFNFSIEEKVKKLSGGEAINESPTKVEFGEEELKGFYVEIVEFDSDREDVYSHVRGYIPERVELEE